MSHIFHDSIMRAYDIRGIYQETLHLADAYALGRSFATYLNKPGAIVAVGRDGRLSSPALAEKLIQGLLDSGMQVKDIGVGPTPLLYFAQKHLDTDAGIMVSGSHNPAHYNGFKMCLASGPMFGEHIRSLGEIARIGSWVSGEGSYESIDISKDYINMLLGDFQKNYVPNASMKVAWDPGNGAAGAIIRQLIEGLPGKHILMNEEIDGRFPHHHPDPSVEENLTQLKELVVNEGCDFGLAFDGDGDRIGVVDAQGRVIWGDMLVALFAEEVIKSHPSCPILMDIKSSRAAMQAIQEQGGNPILFRTGHSYIKARMKEIQAPLAGELSGHMFFADRYYGFDDGIYAALRFLGRFSSGLETPVQWLDRQPRSHTSPERFIESTSTSKFAVVSSVAKVLEAEGIPFIAIDGVRVETEQGWWLLRASHTQDILVVRMEATTAEGLSAIQQHMESYLRPHGIVLS